MTLIKVCTIILLRIQAEVEFIIHNPEARTRMNKKAYIFFTTPQIIS